MDWAFGTYCPVPVTMTLPPPLMMELALKFPEPALSRVRVLVPTLTVAPELKVNPPAELAPMVALPPRVIGPTQAAPVANVFVSAPWGDEAKPVPAIFRGSAFVMVMPLTFRAAPVLITVLAVVVPKAFPETGCRRPAFTIIWPAYAVESSIERMPVPILVILPAP